jgi:hypothetical protein
LVLFSEPRRRCLLQAGIRPLARSTVTMHRMDVIAHGFNVGTLLKCHPCHPAERQ